MEWMKLAGAIGIGAIVTKLLDILWLQNAVRESEKRRWLRDRKFEVYSDLVRELLSLGRRSDLRNDPFEGYALAAHAILITEDDSLASDIELFFTWQANIFKEAAKLENDPTKKPKEEIEGAYQEVYSESRRLVKELRGSLHDV